MSKPQTESAEELAAIIADMELVHRQMHCVMHLCDAVKEVAKAKADMMPLLAAKQRGFSHHMIKRDGGWSYAAMDFMGDILNGLGAVDAEVDAKWEATFREGQKRWARLDDELNGRAEQTADSKRCPACGSNDAVADDTGTLCPAWLEFTPPSHSENPKS